MVTFSTLLVLCSELNILTGRSFTVHKRHRMYVLCDDMRDYKQCLEPKNLASFMDGIRRGYHIGIAQKESKI